MNRETAVAYADHGRISSFDEGPNGNRYGAALDERAGAK
jgi:hypothetical protein